MGKLFEWLVKYYIVTLPRDTMNERLHVHVVRRGKNDVESLAKIWIESNGNKNVEVAYSYIDNKTLDALLDAIDANWDVVMSQVKQALSGNKVKILKL